MQKASYLKLKRELSRAETLNELLYPRPENTYKQVNEIIRVLTDKKSEIRNVVILGEMKKSGKLMILASDVNIDKALALISRGQIQLCDLATEASNGII